MAWILHPISCRKVISKIDLTEHSTALDLKLTHEVEVGICDSSLTLSMSPYFARLSTKWGWVCPHEVITLWGCPPMPATNGSVDPFMWRNTDNVKALIAGREDKEAPIVAKDGDIDAEDKEGKEDQDMGIHWCMYPCSGPLGSAFLTCHWL